MDLQKLADAKRKRQARRLKRALQCVDDAEGVIRRWEGNGLDVSAHRADLGAARRLFQTTLAPEPGTRQVVAAFTLVVAAGAAGTNTSPSDAGTLDLLNNFRLAAGADFTDRPALKTFLSRHRGLIERLQKAFRDLDEAKFIAAIDELIGHGR